MKDKKKDAGAQVSKRSALVAITDPRNLDVLEMLYGTEFWQFITMEESTAELLRQAGIESITVRSYFGLGQESQDSQFRPMLLDAISARRDAEELKVLLNRGIKPIEMAVINFPQTHDLEAMTNDDLVFRKKVLLIASNNPNNVITVVDPNDYHGVVRSLFNDGVTLTARRGLAQKGMELASNTELNEVIFGWLKERQNPILA